MAPSLLSRERARAQLHSQCPPATFRQTTTTYILLSTTASSRTPRRLLIPANLGNVIEEWPGRRTERNPFCVPFCFWRREAGKLENYVTGRWLGPLF